MKVKLTIILLIVVASCMAEPYLKCTQKEVNSGIRWPNYDNVALYLQCVSVGQYKTVSCEPNTVFTFIYQTCTSQEDYVPAPPLDILPTDPPTGVITTPSSPTGSTEPPFTLPTPESPSSSTEGSTEAPSPTPDPDPEPTTVPAPEPSTDPTTDPDPTANPTSPIGPPSPEPSPAPGENTPPTPPTPAPTPPSDGGGPPVAPPNGR